jgi:hypothetical protein
LNDIEISGERLFLLYAYPCAETRELHAFIRPEDVKELEALVDGGLDPSHELLERCFPNAVWSFGKSAGINPSAENPWPFEKVRGFWRSHRGDAPECAVSSGKVSEVGEISIHVGIGGIETPVFNRYGLKVEIGDTVFIHKHVIVEAERTA